MKASSNYDRKENTYHVPFPFTYATSLYTDRKLALLTMMYVTHCIIIYSHFSLKKFMSQIEILPQDATRYWWKVTIPTFEFGTMHFILFNLALIPLTMSRFVISKASKTFLKIFIPFNEAAKIHIALGYIVVTLLGVSTITFVTFFVVLGDFDKLKSEIMISGYIIFGIFVILLITSYLRHFIRYQIFYTFHHLFLIIYFATILHTMDKVQRQQGGRSQTWKWISVTFLLYICDRVAMYLNNRFKTQLDVQSTTCGNITYLKVLKPNFFHFEPGQYVYLKIPIIDSVRWHPFSIASSPGSQHLEFYIESCNGKSWTAKLLHLVKCLPSDENHETITNIDCEVMGPYGTSFGKTKQYSHALLIGAGTGVVPNLSVMKQYIDKALTLRPEIYVNRIQEHHRMVNSMIEDKDNRKISCRSYFCSKKKKKNVPIDRRTNEAIFLDKKAMIHKSQCVVYKFVPLLFFPSLGMLMAGLTISWNAIPFESKPFMNSILMYGTFLFHVLYLTFTMATLNFESIFNYIDLIIVLISAVSDCYWTSENSWGDFNNEHIIYYSILMGYMTLRSWSFVLNYNISPHPIEYSNKRKDDLGIFEHVRFVWVTRNACAVALILPTLEKLWIELCDIWGLELARQIFNISIHCTCKNERHVLELKERCQYLNLYQKEGVLSFHNRQRPSIQQIITQFTLDRINDESLKASHTMFVFCGASSMMSTVKQQKLLNDVGLLMTNNTNHKIDLIVESFAGHLDVKKRHHNKNTSDDEDVIDVVDDDDKNKILQFRLSPKNTVEWNCS